MGELAIRFVLGGCVVSAFAVLSDALRPRSFAGIFGAAPSVALASVLLSYAAHGAPFVAIEGRSMLLGAAALFVYSATSAWVMRRNSVSPWVATLALWSLWLLVAFALWYLVVRA